MPDSVTVALANAPWPSIGPTRRLVHIVSQETIASRLVGLPSMEMLRPAMPSQSISEKAFGGRKITILTEPELNRFATAVDGTIRIAPSLAVFAG